MQRILRAVSVVIPVVASVANASMLEVSTPALTSPGGELAPQLGFEMLDIPIIRDSAGVYGDPNASYDIASIEWLPMPGSLSEGGDRFVLGGAQYDTENDVLSFDFDINLRVELVNTQTSAIVVDTLTQNIQIALTTIDGGQNAIGTHAYDFAPIPGGPNPDPLFEEVPEEEEPLQMSLALSSGWVSDLNELGASTQAGTAGFRGVGVAPNVVPIRTFTGSQVLLELDAVFTFTNVPAPGSLALAALPLTLRRKR